MLYQLLVGELPFSGEDLRQAGALEMQRILREVDPPKPSTKLTSAGDRTTSLKRRTLFETTRSQAKTALKRYERGQPLVPNDANGDLQIGSQVAQF